MFKKKPVAWCQCTPRALWGTREEGLRAFGDDHTDQFERILCGRCGGKLWERATTRRRHPSDPDRELVTRRYITRDLEP